MNPFARLFWSVIFILAGGTAIAVFGKVASLQCTRIEPIRVDCQLTASGILGTKTTTIAQLQDAALETSRSHSRQPRRRNSDRPNRDRNDPTYRVILIGQNGRIPLTEYYSSGRSGHENKVKKIRTFLNTSTQKQLKIEQDSRWLIYPVGGIFMAIGLAVLCGARVQQR